MRARMAIYMSDIRVELREVVLRDKPAAMLECSPKGTVPVLVMPDGNVIDESLDVMFWALGQNDPEDWLGEKADILDEMRALIDACDGDFKFHLDRYKYASRYEGAVAQDHRMQAEKFLGVLEQRLKNSAYLFGQAPKLADYAIMPFIRQFANTDRSWFDIAPYPELRKWLQGLMDDAPFTDIMTKYEQWHAGDAPLLWGKSVGAN